MLTTQDLHGGDQPLVRLIDLCPVEKRRNQGKPLDGQERLPMKKVVIVGDGASGKTSLLLSFARAAFPVDYAPTVFDSYAARVCYDAREGLELQLWDTAGQEDYDRLRPLSYTDADAVILAYSVDSGASIRNVVDKWAPEIAHYLPRVPVVLVGLKADLRQGQEAAHMIFPEDAAKVAARIGAAASVECSAKLGRNIDAVFLSVYRALQGPRHARKRSFTDKARDALQGGVMRKLAKAFACVPSPSGPHPGLSQIVD